MIKKLVGFVIIGVIVVIAYSGFKRVSKDNVLIPRAYLDSLRVIASMPPDTVILPPDTVIGPERIVRVPVYKPIPGNEGEVKNYEDTVKTSDITIYISDQVQGEILYRSVGYRMPGNMIITRNREITITKPLPVLIRETNPFNHGGNDKNRAGGYIQLSTGTATGIGGGVIKGPWMIGGEILRYQGENLLLVKGGIRF